MAIEVLEERIRESDKIDSDDLHEIADSMIPVYTSDLLALARDNYWLITTVSENICSDQPMTPDQLIAYNIYDALIEHMNERLEENKK